MSHLIASLKITSAPGVPTTVTLLRLEETVSGYRIKYYLNDDKSPAMATQNVVHLSREVANEQINQLASTHIPVFPPYQEVPVGELFDLAIFSRNIQLHVAWLSEAPSGYEALENFVIWLRTVGIRGECKAS